MRIFVHYSISLAVHAVGIAVAMGLMSLGRFQLPRAAVSGGGGGSGANVSTPGDNTSFQGAFFKVPRRTAKFTKGVVKQPPKTDLPLVAKIADVQPRALPPPIRLASARSLPAVASPPRRIPPPRLPDRATSQLTAASTRDDRQVQSPTVTRAPPTLAVVDFAGSSGQAGGPSGGHGGNGRLGLAANGTAGSGAGRGGAGRVNGVPTALVSNPLPPYPPDLLASGVEGVVLLRVSILADGRVAEAKLETSSGHASLDESALTTVRDQWRFAPAQRNGIDVPCEVLLPIRFRVRDGN